MKIKHTDIRIGDLFLSAQNGKLAAFQCVHITKSGSIKASFYDVYSDKSENKPDLLYYESRLVTDVSMFNKTKYFPLSTYHNGDYESFFWLLSREKD